MTRAAPDTAPADPLRPAFRLLFRLDRLLDRLSSALSLIYITLVLVLLALATIVYVRHLRPALQPLLPPIPLRLHTALSLYLLLSTATNYLRCLFTSAGRPQSDPESAPPRRPDADPDADPSRTRSETWRHCLPCRAPKPPRAHHCSVCNACFHRLCHHCPAFARCIGRDNYPFFARFVAAACAGALLGAASCALVLRAAPHNARHRDPLFFGAVAACAVAVAVGVLAVWHAYLLATGQTTIEWLENVQMRRRGLAPPEWGRWGGPFDKGLRGNVKEAFGQLPGRFVPWWAVLLLPVGRVVLPEAR